MTTQTAKQPVITEASAAAFVKAGTGGKARVVLRDGKQTGFALALTKGGSASWWYEYRLKGAGRAGGQKTYTIGSKEDFTVEDARTVAKALAGQVAVGVDPQAVKKADAQKDKRVLSAALDDYEKHLESRGVLKKATMMSSLRRGVAPLLKQDIGDLNRKALVERIEKVSAERGPGAGADLRKFLATFLARQVNLGIITVHPLAGLRLERPTRADIASDEDAARVLTDEQVVTVWHAAARCPKPFGDLVRFGILSGLRRGELAALRWEWIDREDGKITIPAVNMKAGREHVVPVTAMMADILDSQPKQTGEVVFPSSSRVGGNTPLSGWTQLVAKLRTESKLPWLGLHDLRRSYRSRLADLGISEPVAETMIAHKRPDLVARYNRSQMWKLRVDAAKAHDKAIAALLAEASAKAARENETGNVVNIATGSKR